MDALAHATGKGVAAASRPVGAESRGGTWTLDVTAGAPFPRPFPDAAARAAFAGLLTLTDGVTTWNGVDAQQYDYSFDAPPVTFANGWTAQGGRTFEMAAVILEVFGNGGNEGSSTPSNQHSTSYVNNDNFVSFRSADGDTTIAYLEFRVDQLFDLDAFAVHFRGPARAPTRSFHSGRACRMAPGRPPKSAATRGNLRPMRTRTTGARICRAMPSMGSRVSGWRSRIHQATGSA